MSSFLKEIKTEVRQLITAEQAWYYRIVPSEMHDGIVTCLTDSDADKTRLETEISLVLGIKSHLVRIEKLEMDALLAKNYFITHDSSLKKLHDTESNDFVQELLLEASELNCSDVHLEPFESECRIRFRMDGELKEKYRIQEAEYLSLINRIKIMARLDISERRLPQDGRIQTSFDSKRIDIRVSIIPTIRGEKIVLRLLGSDASYLDINDLGFSDEQKGGFLESLKKSKGIILISGPTGSGKTTTLYATLKILNTGKTNILTVEDPVEYTLDGINQVQAKEDIGLGFSKVLKSFLRQDPDIIMLGEIRDEETAQIAVRLALTGHLVLSTIHTNSSWGTLSRLMDMGIPSYLLADTLITTMAQRLVRKLCIHCKRKVEFDSALLPKDFKYDKIPSHHCIAIGCNRCFHSGYSGRRAIYEVVAIDRKLAEIIRNGDLHAFNYRERNIMDLKTGAFQLFSEGTTSLEEIYSILID